MPPTFSSTARRIAALVEPGLLRERQVARSATGVIDATGTVRACPAASTSTLTWSCPSAARTPSDTFETGTRAAAFGGTTSIIDFAIQRKGEDLHDGLDAWHEKADGNCAIDYGFHMIVSDVTSRR